MAQYASDTSGWVRPRLDEVWERNATPVLAPETH